MQFLRFSDAKAQISALETLNADLEAQLETARQTSADLIDSVEASAADAANFEAEVDDLTERLAESDQGATALTERVAELDAELSAANQILESFDSAVEGRAAEFVASIGHEPIDTIPEDDAPEASLLTRYNAIGNPAEKSAFWNEHKSELIGQ